MGSLRASCPRSLQPNPNHRLAPPKRRQSQANLRKRNGIRRILLLKRVNLRLLQTAILGISRCLQQGYSREGETGKSVEAPG